MTALLASRSPELAQHVRAWLTKLARRLRHQHNHTDEERQELLGEYTEFLLRDEVPLGVFGLDGLHHILRERDWFPTYATLLRELREFSVKAGLGDGMSKARSEYLRGAKLWAQLIRNEGGLTAARQLWPDVARKAGLPPGEPNKEQYEAYFREAKAKGLAA